MVGFSQHQMMLPGMRPRPEKILVDKKDAKENIKSESNATFIFIKGCENYELNIEGKAAKVMCENCANLTVSLDKPLVSRTMELLRSHDVFIKLLDSCEVPIFQIDESNNVWIEITDKSQLKSLYFQRSNGIKVLLSGSHGQEFDIDTTLTRELSNTDDIPQWIAHWNEGSTQMVTENVNRMGIYPMAEQREAKDTQS